MTFTAAHLYVNVYMQVGVARALVDSSDFGLLRTKFPKMGDSLPWTPIYRHAKCDVASFILGREIRNRTNKHTQKTVTVTDISQPCLSACVDN